MRPPVPARLKHLYHGLCRTLSSRVVDRALNVDTAGRVHLADLGIDATNRSDYEAASWLDLRRILKRGEISPDDVFLDLGSGKGRMVLMAARLPFRRVIGVELAEELTAVARHNVETCRVSLRCRNIELVTADVVEYRIPDDVTVVYMANPFHGPVLDAAIDHLIESVDRRPRSVRVIYRGDAAHREHLHRRGRFLLVRTAPGLRPTRAWRERTAIFLYALQPPATG